MEGTMETIWEQTKAAIKGRMPSHSYRMWIDPLELKASEGDQLVLACPNAFSKKRVQDHYLALIDSELLASGGKSLRIRIDVEERRGLRPPPDPLADRQLTLPNISPPASAGRVLRRGFTFDNFVVGDGNDFAYSAALSLASRRNMNQNAMFLLSETGLGKSHLSQAVGHYILSKCPTESVYYITAEDFTNEMVTAFKSDSINAFKEKYRAQCDVLILEDIHFLTGKDRTQIELALALDYLLDAEKKIIFSSCYMPADIPKMNDQLRSRLSCGLTPVITPPDFRTRMKILQRKAAENGCALPREVLEYLASELSSNVRQLESGLIGVSARSSLMGQTIDLTLARDVIQSISRPKRAITIDLIQQVVSRHYKISVEDMVSRSRKQAVARPRHIAIYLSRKFTDLTLQSIGKSFNRYHATIYRSVGTVEKGLKNDNTLKKQIKFLSEKLHTEV